MKKIETASWLIGTWSGPSTEKGTNYETWKKYNDTTFVGSSFSIQHDDTIPSESIRLVQQGEEVSYVPTVEGQNSDLPVAFKLIFMDSVKMIFENKTHDFPQNISYQKISQDSLVAEISGTIKGTYHAEQFPMRRE